MQQIMLLMCTNAQHYNSGWVKQV